MPTSGDDYLNPKQQLFCQFRAGGETQLKAYELAGYTPSSSNANNLEKRPAIKQRIEELRREHEQREMEFALLQKQANGDSVEIEKNAQWTFQRIMDMMAENARLAQIAGEYKAANETLKMMGEAMKLFEKATSAKEDKLPAANTINLIGRVVQDLGNLSDRADEPSNALAPRR